MSNYQKAKEEQPTVVNQRHLNAKASVADITIEVENDQWETARKLAQAPSLASKTVHATLHKDLQLSKKSAR
jgi:predicted Zn-dependent protease